MPPAMRARGEALRCEGGDFQKLGIKSGLLMKEVAAVSGGQTKDRGMGGEGIGIRRERDACWEGDGKGREGG